MHRFACLIALLTVCLPGMAAPDKSGPKVVAYYYLNAAGTGPEAIARIPARKLTHINLAFINIRDGQLILDEAEMPGIGKKLAALRTLKRRHPHLGLLISVGGWSWSKDFSLVAATPAAREKFSASTVALLRSAGLDGADIDWEFPVEGGEAHNHRSPDDKRNYTLLLQSLRTALDAAGKRDRKHYLLTVATGATAQWLRNTEMPEATRSLDWINLMSYDFSGPWSPQSGHVAPLDADPANPARNAEMTMKGGLKLYLDAGIPANKLVIGLPFYGYTWAKCPPERNGQYHPCKGPGAGTTDGALTYAQLKQGFINLNGYVRYWNSAVQSPYLYNADNGDFITYDDPESFGHKLALVKQHGLAGAMFWHLGGDSEGELVDAVRSGMGLSRNR